MIRTNWKLTRTWGLRLLGIWLIASALIQLLSIHFPESGTILAILAGTAGVLILFER